MTMAHPQELIRSMGMREEYKGLLPWAKKLERRVKRCLKLGG